MKTYLLRTLYETHHLNFTDEGALCDGDTGAKLVRECTYPKLPWRITGGNKDGTQNVTAQALNVTYRGKPLLLEIHVIKEFDGTFALSKIRQKLESTTAAIVALTAWALPGTIGEFIADWMLSRDSSGPSHLWHESDLLEFKIEGYHASLESLVSSFRDKVSKFNVLAESRGKTASAATRWLRHGYSLKEPVDKLVSWWIVLEATANELGTGTIHQRVDYVLGVLFPRLAADQNGERIRKMRNMLGRVRHSAVHAGKRESTATAGQIALAEHVALACIEYLVASQLPYPPRQEWLDEIGI